jgi:hypothetical protein
MKRAHTKYALVFVAAFFLVGLFFYFHENTSLTEADARDADVLRAEYKTLIEKFGGVGALEYFSQEQSKVESSKQHIRAHYFGEMLYKVSGPRSLVTCSSDFGFGCIHGFLIYFIGDRGTEAVKEANSICISTYGALGTGCTHGIGHGIVEFLGNTDVKRALSYCSLTTQIRPLLGCTSGVFMEYFTPAGGGDGRPTTRVFDVKNPFDICPTIPTEFQQSCFYEVVAWWDQVLNGDIPMMASFCESITTKKHRQPCLLGLGYVAGQRTYPDIDAAKKSCEFLKVKNDRVFCTAGVGWRHVQEKSDQTKGEYACRDFTGQDRNTCVTYSDFTNYK